MVTREVVIRARDDGGYQVLVDGHDVSEQIVALTLSMRADDIPTLIIEQLVKVVDVELPDVDIESF